MLSFYPLTTYCWIDHCFTSGHDAYNVIDCKIVPFDNDDVSDHLILRMQVKTTTCSLYEFSESGKPNHVR